MALLWSLLSFCGTDFSLPSERVRVTVVVILASNEGKRIDPKLQQIATEVQKKHPELTNFRIEKTMARSIPIGDQSVFPLVEKAELLVVVEAAVSEDRRVNLSITPPQMKAITYTCRCGKFFPILTRHQTESGERLIIGIMGEPCLKGQKPTP